MPALEGEGACGRHHRIGGLDVILDQNRHAVQWPARSVRAALLVQCGGDLQRTRIGLEHGTQLRAVTIQRLDTIEVDLRQAPRREVPVGHCRGDVGEVLG